MYDSFLTITVLSLLFDDEGDRTTQSIAFDFEEDTPFTELLWHRE